MCGTRGVSILMDQKKIDLIQSGMKLFAQKGYHKTSIQEIATEAGISKGAFYLYFDSKEQFIGTALQYFHNQLKKQIADASMEELPPKQNLSQQIFFITTCVYEHRNFIIMHLREDISIGDHAENFFQQMKIDNYHWLRENVEEIYSDQVEPYLFEIIIQLEGLINGFLKWLVIDQLPIDKNRIGPYIVKRLDDIVQGILQQDEDPLIQMDHLPTHYQSMINEKNVEEELKETLITLKNK